jgi:hypothetical protein
MTNYQQVATFNTGDTWDVAFNLDNRTIAAGGLAGLLIFPVDAEIVQSSDRVPYRRRTEYIGSLDWNSDGTKIAYGTQAFGQKNAEIYIVNSKGELLKIYQAEQESILSIVWSPDDKLLVTSSIDGSIKVWDAAIGKLLQNFLTENPFGTGVSFSLYGGRLSYGLRVNPSNQSREESGIAIVVPDRSLDRLQSIASLCLKNPSARAAEVNEELSSDQMQALTLESLPTFIEQVKALPEDAIPAACAADLIAVAEAVISKEE